MDMRKKLAVDICWQRLPHADASLWHPEEAETFKLNNGLEMPSIGLGTWQSPKGEVAKAVEAAIKCGYRHIE